MTPLSSSPPSDGPRRPDDPGAETVVVRRAPFSDNPTVGARGQRTQQQILDAALEVFAEDGYQQCRIDKITTRAGCSRASFYQYFSNKEELFNQLTGQVARLLGASADALGPVTGDQAGWEELRAWMQRYADVYDRYESVFRSFDAASESDSTVATGSQRWAEGNLARIREHVGATSLTPLQLDLVLRLLVESTAQTQRIGAQLRSAVPGEYSEQHIGDAATDVFHRSLFGRIDGVNVHPRPDHRPAALRFDPAMARAVEPDGGRDELSPTGQRTLDSLMEAGRQVFAELGYHRTRVDDVVEVAGVSHGAFYRYFENKEQLARILTARGVQAVSVSLSHLPVDVASDPASGRAELRRWLRRYNAGHTTEGVMARVWADAAMQDAALEANMAAAFDWGRRKLAAFLEPRGFGDVDNEAVVMVALLSSFGARVRDSAEIDAAAHIIERGFLGL